MYQNTQLGNFSDTLKKVRKVVHKIFPRELSPSRMLEKYVTDAKNKAAAKLTNLTNASVTANEKADAATVSRIATLQLQTLPDPSASGDTPSFNAPPVKVKEPFDSTPYLWLGVFALAGALYVIRSRR